MRRVRSVAVVIGGTLILLHDWRMLDLIVARMIAGDILWHSASEIWPVIPILEQCSPETSEGNNALAAMEETPGVLDVHHLRLWQMGEHEPRRSRISCWPSGYGWRI